MVIPRQLTSELNQLLNLTSLRAKIINPSFCTETRLRVDKLRWIRGIGTFPVKMNLEIVLICTLGNGLYLNFLCYQVILSHKCSIKNRHQHQSPFTSTNPYMRNQDCLFEKGLTIIPDWWMASSMDGEIYFIFPSLNFNKRPEKCPNGQV